MLVCPCCGTQFDKGYMRADGVVVMPDHCESEGSIVECRMSWATIEGPMDEIMDSILIIGEGLTTIPAIADFDVVLKGIMERVWNS